eukprot:IDg17086t1
MSHLCLPICAVRETVLIRVQFPPAWFYRSLKISEMIDSLLVYLLKAGLCIDLDGRFDLMLDFYNLVFFSGLLSAILVFADSGGADEQCLLPFRRWKRIALRALELLLLMRKTACCLENGLSFLSESFLSADLDFFSLRAIIDQLKS